MTSERPEYEAAGELFAWESREVAEAWRERWPLHEATLGVATERMLDLAGVATGDRVLDVAAGTGEQTLAVARRVGPGGSVLATDISAAMLAVAADVVRREGRGNVATLVADARRLDLPPGSFDAAISRFGVMLVGSSHDALAAIRRALKPGGRFAAMVWSAPGCNPLMALPLEILADRGLLPPPAPGRPGPFALAAPGALEDELRRAGFHGVAGESAVIRWRFPSPADALAYLRLSTAALPRETVRRLAGPDGVEFFAEVERALGRFRGPDGLDLPGEVVIAVGAT
jgi:SAM-dependent methyltransferase